MNKKKTVIRWNIHVVNINVGIDKKNLKERTIIYHYYYYHYLKTFLVCSFDF